jgi:L-ascorbate metabolism protein UlaG (beta-lactamase superfamily)
MKIEVLGHASIKLTGDKVIYVDPYNIKDELHDADYIFITHDHYDHYDPESIEKVRNDHTKIVVPYCLKDKEHHLLADGYRYYEIDGIKFTTVPSYNINKQFHPREKYYVGYNILLEDKY